MKTKTHKGDEEIAGRVAKRLLNIQDPQPMLDLHCPHCGTTLIAEMQKFSEGKITYFHAASYGNRQCPNVFKRYRVSIPVIEVEP